jgi:hypothetical protein
MVKCSLCMVGQSCQIYESLAKWKSILHLKMYVLLVLSNTLRWIQYRFPWRESIASWLRNAAGPNNLTGISLHFTLSYLCDLRKLLVTRAQLYYQ